jgi:hypothetical protein
MGRLVGVPDKCVELRFFLTEVTKGTPKDEQKLNQEERCDGDPQPSFTWLAAGHIDDARSHDPNASHKQQDQERHVLRHGHKPGRGPYPSAARHDPRLPETDCSHHYKECASRSFTREEEANSYDDNDYASGE